MISVLYVLCQPVLGPVDLFTTNRNVEIIKDHPELVVLHLVVNTVIPGNCTVLLPLILEVVKQNIILLIKSGVLEE